MGVLERQKRVRAYREQIPSPGRPTVAWREDRVKFWAAIARGVKTEDACVEARVSAPVGFRWFRHAGGVNPRLPAEISGRYLSFAEREDIAIWHAQGASGREIARRLGRDPSTISRELRHNASTRTYKLDHRASTAQWHAERCARRPKAAKLVRNQRLRDYVQARLSGDITDADGQPVGPAGPTWKGRNKPHRGDRRWATAWSPEQIAQRLPVEFPDDEDMRISHEAIYQALYVEGRGALKRELVACLRTGRALRVPRARNRQKAWAHVTDGVLISERPAEAEDRAVPGHWESDLIIGLKRSAIGTLVDRTTRFTMLIHLPREKGYGVIPRTKNGPALAGYGAITMKNALADTMTTLPEQLRRSLTWDRGKELSAHAAFKVETGIPVYFADPHSPWQRGTNENTNGLLRQYFPKGTDLSRWSREEIQAVAEAVNNQPRKTLGWKTPAEALNEQLRSLQQAGVATID
ncbi:IS30 family transposase [Streptomyces sp. NBC_00264]|uniref:IS30 family transposase n=1 Tax=unclassified Streptomyces TaxID=2593676 RepID=UPI00225B3CD8|nr:MULTISPECIES: IS30 family transposase [unclassified Streptomyces]MCX5165216.1 IS30 family transposase [Streptomyces sp. NBC_00305]MCX5223739.1 IS30 family transposase [Streptomyces sp. NBC_00264]WSC32846.1 IS30 family transposase [Streptomyces sp. NBC_01768]